YFGMAGYVFNISSTGNVKFRPSVLLKYVEETPFQADINGSFLFLDKLWLGASYRTGASIDFNLEWNLTRQLRIGYAYDYVLGELGQYTTGSHEVLIGFDLDFRNDRIVTPRNLSPIYF
ncbi:MAG: type IX secretion system PorP/SprF family membrane protein, partial [Limisphaerales bacterium]